MTDGIIQKVIDTYSNVISPDILEDMKKYLSHEVEKELDNYLQGEIIKLKLIGATTK